MVSPPSSRESQQPPKPITALHYELLTFGDELLLGLAINTHLGFIGAQLGRRGVTLARNVVVTDDAAAIARQIRESWARADVVLTTGGLGPTCDDRTRETIAGELGEELVFDAEIERTIAARFGRIGRPMTPNNRKQAFRFARGEVLPNPNGTAPGLWLARGRQVLVMLPGPPNELQPMFMEQVVPRLASLGLLGREQGYVQVRTAGVGESALETRLQPVLEPHGEALSVAYCAHQGQVDCRLSSPSGALDAAALQRLAERCAALLGEDFLCYGHDSVAKVCADLLRSADRRVATAESITGGMLATCFSDIPGAGKFFAGGCVCSSNDAKTQLLEVPEDILLQHGAVSAENAVAMAAGAAEKLGADYGVAICGFAGAGVAGEEPVGTVFLALYTPEGVWSRQLGFPGSRATVKQRAISAALDWLRRELVRAQSGRTTIARRSGAA